MDVVRTATRRAAARSLDRDSLVIRRQRLGEVEVNVQCLSVPHRASDAECEAVLADAGWLVRGKAGDRWLLDAA